MSGEMEERAAEVDEGGMNRRTVHCKYCNSTVLEPAQGTYVKFEYNLPLVTQKKNETQTATEPVEHFWQVNSVYTFYNVGISNKVDDTKFLICADCDMGPIGYLDLITQKSFVCLDRVVHK